MRVSSVKDWETPAQSRSPLDSGVGHNVGSDSRIPRVKRSGGFMILVPLGPGSISKRPLNDDDDIVNLFGIYLGFLYEFCVYFGVYKSFFLMLV